MKFKRKTQLKIQFAFTVNDEDFEKLYDIKAESLTPYAVEIRYPDEFYFPSLEEAKEAIKIAEEVKSFVIEKLNKSGFLKK
jgi:uncharacterized protein YecE (DUF72 family)